MTAIADASDVTLWSLWGWALALLIAFLVVLLAGLLRGASRLAPTPTDAAPASDEPAPMPVRARTTGPALRVHLCASCGTHGVPRPGEWCMPCVYRTSPVHRAEEILAEAARKTDAS